MNNKIIKRRKYTKKEVVIKIDHSTNARTSGCRTGIVESTSQSLNCQEWLREGTSTKALY
jgi:hypothetical protein